MNAEEMTPRKQEKETMRTEAFSDGVFAIAITLLVLDLRVPKAETITEGGGLGHELLALWPVYIAFFTSFVNILIMWINHHKLFTHIRGSDGKFLFINGVLLLTVTIVPFPTALLSEYLLHPGASIAAAVYSGMFILNCVTFNILWYYAADHGLVNIELDRKVVDLIKRQGLFGIPLYLVAFVLAFINVFMSIGICLLLAFYFASIGMRTPGKKK